MNTSRVAFFLLIILVVITLSQAFGISHVSADFQPGIAVAWGDNHFGELGDGTVTGHSLPSPVNGLNDVTDVATGIYHSLALKSDGTVWSWGRNSYGQLGDGTNTDRLVPVQVSNLTGVRTITAGGWMSLALKEDGTVWSWGSNNGNLGDGTLINRNIPVQVVNLTDVVAIASLYGTSLALKSDGTVWGWGSNNNYQLGNGTRCECAIATPVQVSNLTNVIAISIGAGHGLALKSDGTVWGWGLNQYGEVGSGNFDFWHPIPVQVANLSGVRAIAAGFWHSVALKADGTAWAWGDNRWGQLGDQTTVSKYTPVQVSNLSGATTIASGYNHTLALRSDGTVSVWGCNHDDWALTCISYVSSPIQVAGLSDVQAIDAGIHHNLAVTPPPNQAPYFTQVGGPYQIPEGGEVILSATAHDPDGDPLSYAWDLDHDGVFETSGQSPALSAANLDGPGSQNIAVEVTDPGGLSATNQVLIFIQNVEPAASFINSSGEINEGATATLAFSNPYDPSTVDTVAGFLYSYDCTNDGIFEISNASDTTFACTYLDNGFYTAGGRIQDKDGGYRNYEILLTVNNVQPSVGEITAPIDPVQVNMNFNASADFTDLGSLDTHTAIWDWGDGVTVEGTVNETNGSGSVSGSHSYATPGVFTIVLTVIDKDGGIGASSYQYVVVYDPNGGFVTGGGWINSPEGAYLDNPTLSGRSNFGFVAKYQKGATTPIGSTEFQFKVADLNFHSNTYDWLVVAGEKAQFKGVGTINGEGNYKFLLTAIDGQIIGGGGTDKFRIKIWWEDTDGLDHIVYDNLLNAPDNANPTTIIGGGSIVIHKTK